MIEALLEIPEIAEVIHSGEFEFSRDFDLFRFDERYRAGVLGSMRTLADYLNLPYIVDFFESNMDRENWKKKITSEQLEIYHNNALRVGNVNKVSQELQYLERLYLDKGDKQFFRLVHDVRSFERSFSAGVYDTLSPDRKIDLAYLFKERVVDVLRHLEKSGSESD